MLEANISTPQPHPYACAQYATAFAPAEVLALPNANTHALLRTIPGTDLQDACGCYPLFVFDDVDGLGKDFDSLSARGVVSFVGVTDCLTQPDEASLGAHFDLARPFKTHNVYDARQPNADYSKHHRDRVRRAHRKCETRVVPLAEYLDQWCVCYDTLIKRKNITGVQAFPREYFARIAQMESAVTIAAFAEGQFVSGHIWFRHQDKVYAHLAASTELGYKLLSSFAIYDHAIQMFCQDHIIDLGAGAGTEATETDGLSLFKKGFANTERKNYLCGKILDQEKYADLSGLRQEGPDFFPAYRRPGAAD